MRPTARPLSGVQVDELRVVELVADVVRLRNARVLQDEPADMMNMGNLACNGSRSMSIGHDRRAQRGSAPSSGPAIVMEKHGFGHNGSDSGGAPAQVRSHQNERTCRMVCRARR